MFAQWAYFLFVIGSCLATMEQENIDKTQASVPQRADYPDSKISDDIHYVRKALDALDQKVDESVKDIKELKKLTNDKLGSIVCGVESRASEIRQMNPLNVRDRREADGLHMIDILLSLYAKAQTTSSDVKTILSKVDETIENTKQCSKKPDNNCQKPRSCLELRRKGHTLSGVYQIYVAGLDRDIEVYCDQDTEGGGWIVFQRRTDGSVDFYRDWNDYKAGFGELEGEFWLGLDILHHLTSPLRSDLRIDLQDLERHKRFAKYSTFVVGSEASGYRLTSDGYSGNAGDSFGKESGTHNGYPFSTKDVDNDAYSVSCANLYKGGWWYDACHLSNLNGLYLNGKHDSYADGIEWHKWTGYHYSLKFTEMKIREKF